MNQKKWSAQCTIFAWSLPGAHQKSYLRSLLCLLGLYRAHIKKVICAVHSSLLFLLALYRAHIKNSDLHSLLFLPSPDRAHIKKVTRLEQIWQAWPADSSNRHFQNRASSSNLYFQTHTYSSNPCSEINMHASNRKIRVLFTSQIQWTTFIVNACNCNDIEMESKWNQHD